MYHKLLKLTTLCLIIQLCFVNGFPAPADETKPAADAGKAAAETAEKAAKDATETTEKAVKDATDKTKEALEDATKKIEEAAAETQNEVNNAATAATNAAANTPQVTQEELATFMALLEKASTSSGPNNNPLQNLLTMFRNAPNPLGMLQSLISSLGPLSSMFETVIDGLTNIYIANRPKALEFWKLLSEPFIQMSSFAATPFGLKDTPEKLRSIGFKFAVDNTDNAVQAGNAIASTAPTFMRHVERTGSGLIKMPSLSF